MAARPRAPRWPRRAGWAPARPRQRSATPRRAGDLLAAADRLGLPVQLAPFGDPAQPAPGLLISTVPAGAADHYAERIRQGTLRPGCVLDVVYHPWPTALATAAQQAGVPTAGGFALLLHQAARQVELMTGKSAPVEAMRAAGWPR